MSNRRKGLYGRVVGKGGAGMFLQTIVLFPVGRHVPGKEGKETGDDAWRGIWVRWGGGNEIQVDGLQVGQTHATVEGLAATRREGVSLGHLKICLRFLSNL